MALTVLYVPGLSYMHLDCFICALTVLYMQVEERARLTRLEQVRLLAQQEEEHREKTVARQKKVPLD